MKRSWLYLSFFMLAFSLRYTLILLSPMLSQHIDLQIYRETGQLVVNGINPYNFSDNIELRNKLRTDKENYNEYVSVSQERWNYFTNGNLPLATLFFGGIEYAFGTSFSYRIAFAFFDSILSVLILAFVLNKWKTIVSESFILRKIPLNLRPYFFWLIAGCLGAFSFAMLLWGTYVPEPKGTGLLLILSAIYFSDSLNDKVRMILSPALLGLSISFMGLGIFMVPVCLYHIYAKGNLKQAVYYCFISFLSCMIFLIPFLPEIANMMFIRLGVTDKSEKLPLHGSMWTILYKLTPAYWLLIKNSFIFLFIVINAIGFIRKKVNINVITASLLCLFTNIYLLDGSLDRMNIAIVIMIILLGCAGFIDTGILLTLVYSLYCVVAFFCSLLLHWEQGYDGIFILFFVMIYFIFLIRKTFSLKPAKNEIPSYS